MAIITESQIQEKINEIQKLSKDLDAYVLEFHNYSAQIQEVLTALSVCLNTTGGVSRIQNLANIEFDTDLLGSVSSEAAGIKVNFSKYRITF